MRNGQRRDRNGAVGVRARGGPAGFTLPELLVVIAILALLMSISTMAFRKATDGTILTQARNAVVTYAKIARSYAVANRVETMLVVNPYNGRFELWHANAPAQGGTWDPLSQTKPDGYAYAAVLDSGARLPVNRDGTPRVAVHPVDYNDDTGQPGNPWRPRTDDGNERNLDNLTWAAFCFDASGELVIRTRRIATRSYTMRDGSLRTPPAVVNRLQDESPDLALLAVPGGILVRGGTGGDTAITPTRGFVISEADKMRAAIGDNPTPQQIVEDWLLRTRERTGPGDPPSQYADFADTVILNRYSGQELAEAS